MSKHTCIHTDRPIFSKGRCKQCAMIGYNKKGQSKRKLSIANNMINPVAEKRSILNKIYSEIRTPFLKEHTVCEAGLEGCTNKVTDIHHKAGRQNLFLVCSKFFLPVCRKCHTTLTKNSHFAIENNFSLSRHSNIHIELNEMETNLLEKYKISY